jgi:hypothetical protein
MHGDSFIAKPISVSLVILKPAHYFTAGLCGHQ